MSSYQPIGDDGQDPRKGTGGFGAHPEQVSEVSTPYASPPGYAAGQYFPNNSGSGYNQFGEVTGNTRTMPRYQDFPGPGERDADRAADTPNADRQNSMSFEEDIYRMSQHVKVSYNHVFAEPQGMRTFTKMKEVYGGLFNYTQAGVYNVLSLIIGGILAFVWGIVFGVANFFFVWFIQPITTLYFMMVKIFGDFYHAALRCLCDPLNRSFALLLSNIRGRFSLTIPGLEVAFQRRKGKRELGTFQA